MQWHSNQELQLYKVLKERNTELRPKSGNAGLGKSEGRIFQVEETMNLRPCNRIHLMFEEPKGKG